MEHETLSAMTTAASALADAASTAGGFIAPVAEGLLHVASKVPLFGEAANIVTEVLAACRELGWNQRSFTKVLDCLTIALQWAKTAHDCPAARWQPLVGTCLNALEDAIRDVVLLTSGKLSHFKSGLLGTAKGLAITEQDKKKIDLALDSLNRPILYLSGAMSATGCLATNALETLYAEFEKPIVSDSEWDALAEQFHPGTRSALREQVTTWMDKEPSVGPRTMGADVLFWIHADAGVGKTVFAASLVRELEQKGRLAGAFLFKFNDASRTPMTAMKSLAYQVARRFPVLQESILHGVKMLKTRYDGFESLGRVFKELVAGPLSELPGLLRMISVDQSNELQQHLLKKTKVIVLDGLDEIGAVLRNELLNFFSSSQTVDLLLQTNLRFIVASRRSEKLGLGDIIRCFDASRATSAPIADSEADIRVFCRWKLNALGFPDQFMNDAVDLIVKNSGMKFVYMKMVDKALNAVADTIATVSSAIDLHEAVHDALKRLPVSVDDCYQKYVDQLKDTLNMDAVHSAPERVWALLGVLLACKQPLTVQHAGVIFKDMAPATVNTIAKHLDVVYPLKDGHFQPIHMSFVEWIDKNSRYHSFSGEGHLMLMEFLLGVQKESTDRSVSSHGESHRFFLEYCSDHLVEHMLALDHFNKAYELVTDLPWIQWKLDRFGLKCVLTDLKLLMTASEGHSDLDDVHQGASWLMQCMRYLSGFDSSDWYRDICTQLTGRLHTAYGNSRIDHLRQAAVHWLEENGGYFVVSESMDQANSLSVQAILPAGAGMVLFFTVSPTVVVIVAPNPEESVCTWDLENSECLFQRDICSLRIILHADLICAVDGDRLACATFDNAIVIFSFRNQNDTVLEGAALAGEILFLCFLHCGLLACSVCCDEQRQVYLVDTQTGQYLHALPGLPQSVQGRRLAARMIHSVSACQGNRTVIATGPAITVWNTTSSSCIDVTTNELHCSPHVVDIVFIGSLCDGRMVTVSKDCALFVWSADLIPTQGLPPVQLPLDCEIVQVYLHSKCVIIMLGGGFFIWAIDKPGNTANWIDFSFYCEGIICCCELTEDLYLFLDRNCILHLFNIASNESIELSTEVYSIWCDDHHVFFCLQGLVKIYRKSLFTWPQTNNMEQWKKHILPSAMSNSQQGLSAGVNAILFSSSETVATVAFSGDSTLVRVWNLSDGSWEDLENRSTSGECFALPSSNINNVCIGMFEDDIFDDSFRTLDQTYHMQGSMPLFRFVSVLDGMAGLCIGDKLHLCNYSEGTSDETQLCPHQFAFEATIFDLCGTETVINGVLDLNDPIVEADGVGEWDFSSSGLLIQQGEYLRYWNNRDWNTSHQWKHSQTEGLLHSIFLSKVDDRVCIAQSSNMLILWDLSIKKTWIIDSFEQFMHNDEYCFGTELCVDWPDIPRFQRFIDGTRFMKVRTASKGTRCILAQGHQCHMIEHIRILPNDEISRIPFDVETSVSGAPAQPSPALNEEPVVADKPATAGAEPPPTNDAGSNESKDGNDLPADNEEEKEDRKVHRAGQLLKSKWQWNGVVLTSALVIAFVATALTRSTNIGFILLFATVVYVVFVKQEH